MGELDEKLNAILGNPEAMGQIMALANSLGVGGSETGPQQGREESQPCSNVEAPPDLFSALGEIDPRMIQMGMRVLQEYQSGDDKKTALLNALRPFVREERWEKLDRAIQIAKLSRVIRVLFDTMGREGRGDV